MLFVDLLRDFGESMGMQNVRYDENNLAEFEFENLGRLQLEQGNEELRIALSRPYNGFQTGLSKNALAQSHHDTVFRFPVRSGLSADNRLILFTTLSAQQADLSVLEQILDELSERFRQLNI